MEEEKRPLQEPDEDQGCIVERFTGFQDLRNRTGSRKFMLAGPQNPLCRTDRRYNRATDKLMPGSAFSSELAYLDYRESEQGKSKKDSAISSCMIEEIRNKIKMIFETGSRQEGISFLDEVIGPGRIAAATSSRLAAFFSLIPDIVGRLPDALIIGAARRYAESFGRQAEQMRSRIGRATFAVRDKLVKAVEEKRLPVSVERVEDAVNESLVETSDPVLRICSGKALIGTFDAGNGTISVDMSLSDEELERTIMHEAMHALAGKTYRIDIGEDKIHAVRGGFCFKTPGKRMNARKIRFSWLDEGYTELCAHALSGAKRERREFAKYYPLEKGLVYMIFKDIPDRTSIMRAYFEDYEETGANGRQSNPAWKEIQKYITATFGSGFLVMLDDFILFNDLSGQKGVGLAYREFEKRGKDFPAYLKEFLTPERRAEIRKFWKKVDG